LIVIYFDSDYRRKSDESFLCGFNIFEKYSMIPLTRNIFRRFSMPVDTNIKILLVEDAATMRQMEKKVLSSLNFRNILEAVDGADAIEKLKQTADIGLIISDWNMPGTDGYELLVWCRSNHSSPGIPFLMATGRGEKKEAMKAKEAGVSSFISKPFNAAELQKKIDEALGLLIVEKKDKVDRPKAEVTADGKVKLKLAHIQITDHIVLGLLKNLIATGEFKPKYFELTTECMSSWNPVAESLEKGTVQGACVLAPIQLQITLEIDSLCASQRKY
jgi:CheY-like chemotaxis protein